MHRVRGRSTSSVKIERFLLLIAIQDALKLSVGKDDSSSQEAMGLVSSELFKALEKFGRDTTGSELLDKLVVVDGLDLAVNDRAFDVPWIDGLGDRGGWGFGWVGDDWRGVVEGEGGGFEGWWLRVGGGHDDDGGVN